MVTSRKVGGRKGKEAKEQIGNYCSHYSKRKEVKLIVKLFKQTIETIIKNGPGYLGPLV